MGERERSQARDVCEPAPSRRTQQRNRAADLDEQWRYQPCRKMVSTLPKMLCRLPYGHTGPCRGERGD